ncbi:TPA: hypothetical protein ACGE8L_002694 [Yersinia enterocolitica]|nr:hypothetical protein [Yersinia enterocolitica]EKN4144133.1 hypothetical protein [Yersinia enterocolitica]HDL6729901.1 hypothetical protein [Yersinia enterocolitica]HDL7333148.1 hypothetical protein [Yersinia enterocolitica]HDL8092138.1 hypothetical protein [Yersinia enterocolitica]
MNIQTLMEVIGTKLHPVQLTSEFTVYVKLPTLDTFAKCDNSTNTIYHCIVDSDGNQLFESTVQVEKVDLKYLTIMNTEINKVFQESMNVDTAKTEKKNKK